MLSLQSAGAVTSQQSASKSKSCVKAREGQFLQEFLTPALHGAVCASASGSTENRGLLTSQAVPVSQASLGRQQAFVAPGANVNAAVIRILLGCQNWIPHLRAVDFAMYTSQHRVSLLKPLALWQALDLETCFYPCCVVKFLCTCPALALRPLSAAVNLTSERCAGKLVALCRTATHGGVCAYSGRVSEQQNP